MPQSAHSCSPMRLSVCMTWFRSRACRIVANGNGVWFGYWEGAVPGDQGWSWQHKPLLAEFLKEIETQWDDDDAESPQKAKPAAVRDAKQYWFGHG